MHGGGCPSGSFTNHHDTTEALADAGIVAAINHPGDNFRDMSRCADLSVIVERPTDIKRLRDFMLGASPAAFKIDPEPTGFFGFSRGGYTGLVLVGANPDWATATEFCQRAERPICPPIRRKEFPMQPFVHDPRIKAAVIADPGPVFFFTRTSLAAISVPLRLWASERGNPFVTPESVAAVDRNLPAKHEYHVVRNSRHEDFFLCPPALAKDPERTDASGFDRVVFRKQFNADVLAFFRTYL